MYDLLLWGNYNQIHKNIKVLDTKALLIEVIDKYVQNAISDEADVYVFRMSFNDAGKTMECMIYIWIKKILYKKYRQLNTIMIRFNYLNVYWKRGICYE